MKKYIITDPGYIPGAPKLYESETGIGDWTNAIEVDEPRAIINRNFTADSGRVCVAEFSESVEKEYNSHVVPLARTTCGAIFWADDNPKISEIAPASSGWLQLQISFNFGGMPQVVTTLPAIPADANWDWKDGDDD
jgi:hypothetical protein